VVGSCVLAASFAFSYVLKLQAKAYDFEARLKVAETKVSEVGSNVVLIAVTYCETIVERQEFNFKLMESSIVVRSCQTRK
jgi:hypothetical protein